MLKPIQVQSLGVIFSYILSREIKKKKIILINKSTSIGGAKKLYCYFQHHQIPKCGYIGGAKVIFFGSTATVHSHYSSYVKKKRRVLFTLFLIFSFSLYFLFFGFCLSRLQISSASLSLSLSSHYFNDIKIKLRYCTLGNVS